MKKLIATLTALFLLCGTVTAAASTVYIAPALGIEGDTLTVAVCLNSDRLVSAGGFEISYDSTKLSFLSYRKGDGFNTEYCTVSPVSNGILRLSFTDSRNNFLGSVTLAHITFKVKSGTNGTTEITPLVTEYGMFDNYYIEMEYGVQGGTAYILPQILKGDIEINGQLIYLNRRYAAAEFAQRLGKHASIKENYGYIGSGCTVNCNGNKYYTVVRGDTNGDSLVNTVDYLSLRAYLCGAISLSKAYAAATDFNGDGVVSTADMLNMRTTLTGAE